MRSAILLLACAATLLWAGRATIAMKGEADVSAGRIRLGDIAEIQGDADLVGRLRVLEVGRIELPGRETRVSSEAVKSFYLRAVCPLESWAIEATHLPKTLAVPETPYNLRFELPGNFDGRGQETANLHIESEGKVNLSYTLPFTMRRWIYAVHAVKPIQRGQPVTPDLIALQRIEVTHQNRVLLTRLEDALGRVALRTVARDVDLVDSWLEKPYAVHEGDQVRMTVALGKASISTLGIAKQNGYLGQRIQVENRDSGKRMQVEVRGPGEVQVVN